MCFKNKKIVKSVQEYVTKAVALDHLVAVKPLLKDKPLVEQVKTIVNYQSELLKTATKELGNALHKIGQHLGRMDCLQKELDLRKQELSEYKKIVNRLKNEMLKIAQEEKAPEIIDKHFGDVAEPNLSVSDRPTKPFVKPNKKK
jgi:hypothetical protein